MKIRPNSKWRRDEGQSLLETAILTPFLLSIAFNAINIAYFWFMVLVLSTAPRQGVEYSSQGGAALTTTTSPGSAAIKDIVYDNLTHTINGTVSNASVQVCTVANGVDSTTHKANCLTYGPAYTFPSPDADPEAPVFVLHRVDVAYTVSPLIPGAAFHVLLPANMTFHRQVSMRSLY